MQEMVDRKMFLSEAMGSILFRFFWRLITDLQAIIANYRYKLSNKTNHDRVSPKMGSNSPMSRAFVACCSLAVEKLITSAWRRTGWMTGISSKFVSWNFRPKLEDMALMARLCKPTCATARWRAWPHTRLWWRPTWVPWVTLQSVSVARWHGFKSRLSAI